MKDAVLRTCALVVLSAVWAAAHAAESGAPELKQQISRQEAIYRSAGEKEVDGYTVDRGLATYAQGLPSEFDGTLAKLGAKDRWLDVGAGKAHAILDYFSETYDASHPAARLPRAKAQAVAISIEDGRTPRWQQTAAKLSPDQIQYLMSKRLREYSSEEIGKFQVITDMIGGMSYTENLSLFMEKVLGFLDVNGTFYGILQDVQWEDGTNKPYYKGSPFLTEIKNPDGSELKVCSWLKSIGCAEVTCESRPKWQPPVEAFRVRKVCDNVAVPPLSLLHYEAGTPPERRFQVVSDAKQ
jgi:hypothetical protein